MAILLDKNCSLSMISYCFPILVRRLLVSGQTWEERAMHHSCPSKKKGEQSKDQQLFLDPSENGGPEPTAAPHTGERRVGSKSQFTLRVRTTPRDWAPPYFHEFDLQELCQVLL